MLIAIWKNQTFVVYIEMKGTTDRPEKIVHQLSGAKCVMAYCKEIGRTFWRTKDFLAKTEDRYVCFAHTNNKKRGTRVEARQKIHDKPGNFMKVDWTTRVLFGRLVGKM